MRRSSRFAFWRPAFAPASFFARARAFALSLAWADGARLACPKVLDLDRSLAFSFRRPQQSQLFHFVAHILVRLLLIGPLPAHLQAWIVLWPISMLTPLVEGTDDVITIPVAGASERGGVGVPKGLLEVAQENDS